MDTGTIRETEDEALQFHSSGGPGKLSIALTKSLTTQRDLSLAYSPGVAHRVPQRWPTAHGQGGHGHYRRSASWPAVRDQP